MVFVLMMIPAGVAAGWILTRQELDTSIGTPTLPDTTRHPPDTPLSIPNEDVSGEEVDGLPRYPGSSRIEYRRESRNGLYITEATYLADATLDSIREFYRETFQSEGWSVTDLDFSSEEVRFFVIDGKHEARVNISSRSGEIAEIEITSSRPRPEQAPNSTPQEKPGAKDMGTEKPDTENPGAGPSRSQPEPPAQGPPESTPGQGPPSSTPGQEPPEPTPPAQGPPSFAPPAQATPGSTLPAQAPPQSTPPAQGPPGSTPVQGPPSSAPPAKGPPGSAPGQGAPGGRS